MLTKEKLGELPVQLAILFGTFFIFLIVTFVIKELSFLAPLIGLIIALEIIAFVSIEIKQGAQKHGWKHEIVDTLIAVAVALGVWFGASLLLNTSTPLSAVVSCSMLPNLERGDFVIVQGTELDGIELSMTQEELESLTDRAVVTYQNNTFSVEGSVFSYCSYEAVNNRTPDVCRTFIESPEDFVEEKGAFTYHYDKCPISFFEGGGSYQPCVSNITFKGKNYLSNFSKDTIVYQPQPDDAYTMGDIVHRVVFKVDVDGKKYYLTRGDNNPMLDMQAYDYVRNVPNHPVPEENVRGKVIGRIPLLGYFKLFITGYFEGYAQCGWQLTFPKVS